MYLKIIICRPFFIHLNNIVKSMSKPNVPVTLGRTEQRTLPDNATEYLQDLIRKNNNTFRRYTGQNEILTDASSVTEYKANSFLVMSVAQSGQV